MSRLPRYPQDIIAKGSDLNLILAILDTGGVINISSATSSGISGDGLSPNIPNVAGSVSPSPGGVGAPSTPRGLSAAFGIDNFSQSHTAYVLLSWTPNIVTDFVSAYDIYYHKGSDPTLYNVTVGGDVNSVRINNLFPGNTYSFAIQAHDAANRSSVWSPELNVTISPDADPPSVPTGLTATSTGAGVYLTWTEVGADGISNDLKQYSIAVSLDGGATYPTVRTVGPGNSYFYVPTTANQGTVFFKIATMDWTGNLSALSGAVSAAVGTLLGRLNMTDRLTITGDYSVIGDSIVLGSTTAATKGGALGFADAGTLKWEFYHHSDQTLNLWDSTRVNNAVTFNPNGSVAILPVTSFANGVVLGSGNAGISAPDIHSDGTSIYIEAVAGNNIKLRPGGANTSANEAIVDGSGNFTIGGSNLAIAGSVSLVVPGATSLSLRNHANSADNLILTDAGAATFRSTVGGITTLTATTLAGTLSTAAQPNVTSLGTLTSLTITGDLTENARIVMGASASKIVPGATSLSLRNNADNADNLLLTDAGDLTARLSLTTPYLKTTGVPSLGSAASGRYIGRWTAQGPPTGLTSVTGDFGFDTSGVIWYCTSGGSPGTWLASPFSGVAASLTGSSESTASTSPVDLTTVGPSVTLNTGTQVMVTFSGQTASSVANGIQLIGCAVSGATTVTANADGSHILKLSHATATGIEQAGITYALGGLTAGSNTFTLKYWVNAGTGTFANRLLTILPA